MQNYSGRWNHVFKLWNNALNQDHFPQFDRYLSNEFAKNSQYGSKDRRWYSEILFAAVRHGYFALYCHEVFLSNKNCDFSLNSIQQFFHKYPTCENILTSFKNIPVQDFFSWVCLRYKFNKPDTNDELLPIPQEKKEFFLKLISQFEDLKLRTVDQDLDQASQLLFHSVPLVFLPYFHKRMQSSQFKSLQIDKFFSDLDSRPPLWIRINHLEKKEEINQELKKENYLFEEFGASVKVTGAKGVFTLNSYRNGLFEIQDLASQKIGEHIKVLPKQYVWDCCAGGGGKTLQIASFLKNKGVIYASDIREYKLEEVKKRAKRSGFFNIRCLTWSGETLPAFQKEVQIKGGFDWVLVDAPCSSTGTWRRNPDAKYRIQQESIANLTKLQLNILTNASFAVIPGGHLVYSTCSWVVEENEGVVEEFLKTHPQFSLCEQNLLGSPFVNADTMFAAVLRRQNV